MRSVSSSYTSMCLYVSWPWDSCLLTVENVGDAYDAILEFLERIQAFTSRLWCYFHHETSDILRPVIARWTSQNHLVEKIASEYPQLTYWKVSRALNQDVVNGLNMRLNSTLGYLHNPDVLGSRIYSSLQDWLNPGCGTDASCSQQWYLDLGVVIEAKVRLRWFKHPTSLNNFLIVHFY